MALLAKTKLDYIKGSICRSLTNSYNGPEFGYDHDRHITSQEFNKLTAENFLQD